MELTEAFIEYIARGESASSRARALHGAFQSLCIDEAGTILCARYPGTAADPYEVYADLSGEDAPRFRCGCPSRLRPCKHSLALLWARLLTPERFTADAVLAPLPRTSRLRSAERKPLPLALDTDALCKARNLLDELIRGGFDIQTPALLAADKKRIRDWVLPPAIRTALLRFCDELAARRTDWDVVFARVTALSVLLDRALAASRRSPRPPDWELDTQLGRVWRFEDLKALGYTRTNLRLIQLAFWCEDDAHARRQTDIALWAEPDSGKVWETRAYRPYDAAKALQPEDSGAFAVETDCAALYPGTNRIRWNACRPSRAEADTPASLCAAAYTDLGEACAFAADSLRSGSASPAALLRFRDIGRARGAYYLRDERGRALPLSLGRTPPALLESVYNSRYKACLLRFSSPPNGGLTASPLCLVSEKSMRRLI